MLRGEIGVRPLDRRFQCVPTRPVWIWSRDSLEDLNMPSRANETDVSTGRRSVIVAGLTAPIWLPDLGASAAQKKPASSISPDPRRNTVTMTIVYDNNPDPNRSELIS